MISPGRKLTQQERDGDLFWGFPKNGGSPKMDVVFIVENTIKMDDN